MSTNEHTKGPWRVIDPVADADGAVTRLSGVEGPEHLDSTGRTCTAVAAEVSTVDNARLIVAAPDLYEAAKPLAQLVSKLETGATLRSGSFIGDQYRVKEVRALDLRRLRDAVDRAEGRG
jgi:hypothetical protein